MPISWNEIKTRAIAFSREWESASRENAEAKSFWDDFFRVFGLTRRHVASFEEPVRKLSGSYGFIDLFWKGVLVAEHKSRGKDLAKAESQAMEYIQDLQRDGRGNEVPRYVVVSDFARIALYDLEGDECIQFGIGELHENIHRFGFIPGYKQHRITPEDPVDNINAVRLMGDLHDALEDGGYEGPQLERMLVRVLFCLFAEDTGIFDRGTFELFIRNHTKDDGSDLGAQLGMFFQILNTPEQSRQKNLLEELRDIQYVNGELFAEPLPFAAFNHEMRKRLLACAADFDWGRISPAVFGALFQAVMQSKERRQIGAHYTSESDILKVIGPLFLDDLSKKLENAGSDKKKLRSLHAELSSIKLLDPACGCGNFLVVAYRELRTIELEVVSRLHKGQLRLQVDTLAKVDVDQMYGIEIDVWPARIAEVAMWLMDHQMNLRLSERFGEYFARLPLKKSPQITLGNALQIPWEEVLDAEDCSFVLGNPPFVGAKYQSESQKDDMQLVANDLKNSGLLDYVTGWYLKASDYIQSTDIKVAFVSTNSITQGEQVSVLWKELDRREIEIHFAHRTFAWQSEARGKAHVHVVIVGFGHGSQRKKRLFDYESLKGEPTEVSASNINAYLVDAPSVFVENRSTPLSAQAPRIGIGNKPVDGGNFLFTDEEKAEFVSAEPESDNYFRRWYGSREFINQKPRWCLWLGDCSPAKLRAMPNSLARVEAVRQFRLSSSSKPTQKIAETPTRFHVENQPTSNYLLVPKVSSERRKYIPMGFMSPETMSSDLVFIIPTDDVFVFGLLSSSMHMAWMRAVAGRLKSDYRYSAKVVYNNFPWPTAVKEEAQSAVSTAATHVLKVREGFTNCSLADLYDPLSTPKTLVDAHNKLDRAVDKCYRGRGFENERLRLKFLFELYEAETSPLTATKNGRKRKTVKA